MDVSRNGVSISLRSPGNESLAAIARGVTEATTAAPKDATRENFMIVRVSSGQTETVSANPSIAGRTGVAPRLGVYDVNFVHTGGGWLDSRARIDVMREAAAPL